MPHATSGAVVGPETNHELPSSGLAPGRRRPRVLVPRLGADSQASIGAAWCQWPTAVPALHVLASGCSARRSCASAQAPRAGRPARAVTDGPVPCVEVAMQTPDGADQGHGAAAGLRARDVQVPARAAGHGLQARVDHSLSLTTPRRLQAEKRHQNDDGSLSSSCYPPACGDVHGVPSDTSHMTMTKTSPSRHEYSPPGALTPAPTGICQLSAEPSVDVRLRPRRRRAALSCGCPAHSSAAPRPRDKPM
jgi:hypothetical protein